MVNKIDTAKLEQHIAELTALNNEWSGHQGKVIDYGENGGGVVNQIEAMDKSLTSMQDAFVLLLSNTVSYMTQRKASVDTKDATAAAGLRK